MPPARRRPVFLRACLAGVAAFLGGVLPNVAFAQETPAGANPFGRKYPARVYETGRLQGRPPVIDGRLDDEAWQQGEWAGDYRQFMPTEGAKPSQPTELKILHD